MKKIILTMIIGVFMSSCESDMEENIPSSPSFAHIEITSWDCRSTNADCRSDSSFLLNNINHDFYPEMMNVELGNSPLFTIKSNEEGWCRKDHLERSSFYIISRFDNLEVAQQVNTPSQSITYLEVVFE